VLDANAIIQDKKLNSSGQFLGTFVPKWFSFELSVRILKHEIHGPAILDLRSHLSGKLNMSQFHFF